MTTLTPLTSDHFETVARWLSNPAVNRLLSADWRDKEVTATVLAIAARKRQNRFFLIQHEGKACGLVALSDLEVADKSAMAWYLMGDERFRGKGIAADAVRQLIRFAFMEMGLECIFAWAIEGNTASLSLLNAVGFREVGRIRRSACIAGQQLDRIYFDIIRSDIGSPPFETN
jgi:RimJ/RimL family protein N-acetyltransferase